MVSRTLFIVSAFCSDCSRFLILRRECEVARLEAIGIRELVEEMALRSTVNRLSSCCPGISTLHDSSGTLSSKGWALTRDYNLCKLFYELAEDNTAEHVLLF